MRIAPPPSEPAAAERDVLAELYVQLAEVHGRLAEELARRAAGTSGPPASEVIAPAGDEVLDTKSAARMIGRTVDWFGRHRGEYVSALVSRKGSRPRYSRRLLEHQLELANRARKRSS